MRRPFQIRIIDLSGKVVLNANYREPDVINTGPLKPGFYEVSVKNKDGVSHHKLIRL
jgi:hypothetical protein